MEWITNIISALNVPIKILLPAICLFCGFILFADENTLKLLHLYEWSTTNSFYFGVAFLISSVLIIVYIIWFAFEKTKEIISENTSDKHTLKMLSKLNNAEKDIVFGLYKSEGYTEYVDYSEPIVKSLMARGIIYTGNNAQIHFDSRDSMLVKASLNPAIIQSFVYAKNQLEKNIKRLNRKNNNKNSDAINAKIAEYQNIITFLSEDDQNGQT